MFAGESYGNVYSLQVDEGSNGVKGGRPMDFRVFNQKLLMELGNALRGLKRMCRPPTLHERIARVSCYVA